MNPTDEALIEQIEIALGENEILMQRNATNHEHAQIALAIARKAIEAEMRGEWLPIETAPKDGTVVLVYAENRNVTTKHYYLAWFDARTANKHRPAWYSGSWAVQATHWQPLPLPPKEPV